MNHPYLAAKFREGLLRSNAWGICCLFIVALCVWDVAPLNAQTQVPPPPARTPVRGGVVPPPPPATGLRLRKKPDSPTAGSSQPQLPSQLQDHSVWFNVGWIAAITALITALAGLVAAFRKR